MRGKEKKKVLLKGQMNTDDVLTHSSGGEKAKEEQDRRMDLTDAPVFCGRQMESGGWRGRGGAMGAVWTARQRATTIVKEEGEGGEGDSGEGEVFPELGKYSLCYSNCAPNTCKGAGGDAKEKRTQPRETFRPQCRRSGN